MIGIFKTARIGYDGAKTGQDSKLSEQKLTSQIPFLIIGSSKW